MKKLLAVLLLLCLALPAALGEEAPSTDLTAIRINEFMASNSETLEDQNGETPDWIELYNTSDRPVNLQGLCLSDGKKTLDKFVFPEVVIPAHGYLIVFASGEEDVTELSTENRGIGLVFQQIESYAVESALKGQPNGMKGTVRHSAISISFPMASKLKRPLVTISDPSLLYRIQSRMSLPSSMP